MCSHPDVFLGSAVWIQAAGGHAGVVLSDPEETGGDVLLVRITTYRPQYEDGRQIFTPTDFQELTHDSVIWYTPPIVVAAVQVQKAIDDQNFRLLKPVPGPMLKAILEEAHEPEHLGKKHRSMLAYPDHPACG